MVGKNPKHLETITKPLDEPPANHGAHIGKKSLMDTPPMLIVRGNGLMVLDLVKPAYQVSNRMLFSYHSVNGGPEYNHWINGFERIIL
jgi:hypothetical protein